MARSGLTMQYCMASARQFMQSAKYSNLTTVRTSADRLARDRWNDFLYTSRLASAMGIWPFTDNFLSTETTHMLLAVLSAGPVGVGDAVGQMNAANLLHAVRRDGVIVKPDAALAPIDSSYLNTAKAIDTPQIAATYSDFGGLRTNYVFAYTQGSNAKVQLRPSDLGVAGTVYAYDYFSGSGQLLNPADLYQSQISGDAMFLVLAPVGPSGMALIGDADQFVGMGKKRVPAYTDDGNVRVQIAFAAGEAQRVITGYSPRPPAAIAIEGSVARPAWDLNTKRFRVNVAPGTRGTASIELRPSPLRRGGSTQ